MAERETEVVVQIADEEVLAGRLWSDRRRGIESATFSYATEYLVRRDAYELDPMLGLSAGPHQTPSGRPIFGAFSDCSPDRWGRRLLDGVQHRRVGHEGGAERSLGEIDYVLGVRDDLRQGALRFRGREITSDLADERGGIARLVDLPTLLDASYRLERDEASDTDLQMLLHGGGSLGGARPKAHVLDASGQVAIAKFPSTTNDAWDVTRWEAVALALARASGISVPDWTLHLIDGKAVLIVDRFDRKGSQRIGYVSAMTMLESADGDQGSYIDIADVVERNCVTAGEDLRQLWRRVAFSILICNTDDHLRNHGFLRTSTAGWSLSPAFDLNPDPGPGPKHLSTAIDYGATAARIDVLMEVAQNFRLTGEEARAVLRAVMLAAGLWRAAAKKTGLDRDAVEQMSPAFEHDQTELAREIAGP